MGGECGECGEWGVSGLMCGLRVYLFRKFDIPLLTRWMWSVLGKGLFFFSFLFFWKWSVCFIITSSSSFKVEVFFLFFFCPKIFSFCWSFSFFVSFCFVLFCFAFCVCLSLSFEKRQWFFLLLSTTAKNEIIKWVVYIYIYIWYVIRYMHFTKRAVYCFMNDLDLLKWSTQYYKTYIYVYI